MKRERKNGLKKKLNIEQQITEHQKMNLLNFLTEALLKADQRILNHEKTNTIDEPNRPKKPHRLGRSVWTRLIQFDPDGSIIGMNQ